MVIIEEELQELIVLVNEFIDFANDLKTYGKITEEQYITITKNKIDFLNNVERRPIRKVIELQENLFF